MLEVLNQKHNIVAIDQESLPEHLKGHTLIIYLSEWDLIILTGWKEITDLVVKLIANYLELRPDGHKKVLKEVPSYIKSSKYMDLELWSALEKLYQDRAEITRQREEGKNECIG